MRYEIIPSTLTLWGPPLIPPGEDFSKPGELMVSGVTTLPTSLDDALRRAEHHISKAKRRLRAGDHEALVKLLDDYPEFITDPWVCDELLKWLATGRSYRKRGRRTGSFIRHPLVVAGVVNTLVERGTCANKERAFRWLEEHSWMSYSSAKESYYQARREERFKAVLIENPIGEPTYTQEEIEYLHNHAEPLESGKTLDRTIETPDGPLTITFRGL